MTGGTTLFMTARPGRSRGPASPPRRAASAVAAALSCNARGPAHPPVPAKPAAPAVPAKPAVPGLPPAPPAPVTPPPCPPAAPPCPLPPLPPPPAWPPSFPLHAATPRTAATAAATKGARALSNRGEGRRLIISAFSQKTSPPARRRARWVKGATFRVPPLFRECPPKSGRVFTACSCAGYNRGRTVESHSTSAKSRNRDRGRKRSGADRGR